MTTTICLYWYFVWLSLFSLARLRPTALGYLRAFTICFVKSILSPSFFMHCYDLAHEYDLHRHTHTHFLPPSCAVNVETCNAILTACVYWRNPPSRCFSLCDIALSTQLVRFLRGTSLSEVVLASKSSFYPAIHWDLSERYGSFTLSFGRVEYLWHLPDARCARVLFCMQALRHQPLPLHSFPPPITKHWIGRCFASPVVNQYVLYCMSIGSGVTMAHVW